ncbi:MAG: MBL fold metallo-hydrolase [Spirochaetota bacterium]
MAVKIQFLGAAAYRITTGTGKVILIDPFLDKNPVSPVKVDDLKQVDLVLVTHLAFDHLGDTAVIAKQFGCPVFCGAEVQYWLMRKNISQSQLRAMCWGLQLVEQDIRVRAVASMHTSAAVLDDGQFISGPPMGFIVYPEPGIRVYHSGDSAIFSDMKLIGELYRPNIVLISCTLPPAEFLASYGYGKIHANEMTADEAALAARWLRAEYALSNHYFTARGNRDVDRFTTILNCLHSDESPPVRPVVLEPGEVFTYPPSGTGHENG